MPSVTTWNRLEPRTRSRALGALQARVADPAWLLARQWQADELHASDGGSLVAVSLSARRSALARYLPRLPDAGAAAASQPYQPGVPLEALVEAETTSQLPGAVLAAQAGQCFLRMLGPVRAARYRGDYLRRYPLTMPTPAERQRLDDASRSTLDLLDGRIPDGNALYADLVTSLRPPAGTTPALPTVPAVDPGDVTAVTTAASHWLAWYESLHPPARAEAWHPQRLEYRFAVAAPAPDGTANRETVLVAPGYADGHLDWHAFDVDPGAALGTSGTAAQIPPTVALPTPVRFPGMPNPRWWQFEDGAVNLGAVDVAPDDLGRLLLLEFALVYGNDFFVVPVDLAVGSLCRVEQLTVTTTFGDVVTVEPVETADGGAGSWSMFRLSVGGSTPGRGDFLFLPPTLGPSLHGPDLEQVLFMRDEMANVAWGVEQRVENAAGLTVVPREAAEDRRRRDQAAPLAPAALADPEPRDPELVYRLATDVPDHWYPLVPVRLARTTGGVAWDEVALELGGLRAPEGRLLRVPGARLLVAEAEVPRSGVVVGRAWQRARWLDGSTHVWVGRRKRSGRGEGTSGLRFDVLEERHP
jgi:hypothetical protein